MKITKILSAVLMAALLVGCASNKKEPQINIDEEAVKTVVVDWDGRSLGEEAAPDWLRSLNRGNADDFKEQYNIDAGRICKLAKASAKTEATAQALSRAGFAYSMAAELNQKVIGRVGQGLNDVGQLEAVYLAASETKAEMSGLREEATFWQKVRTEDKLAGRGKNKIKDVYIYYTVYSMDSETWDALLRKYLMDIMGGAQLETETQKKIGALYSEMKEDADKKEAAKQKEEERLYKEQMARIEAVGKSMSESSDETKAAVEEANDLASFLL